MSFREPHVQRDDARLHAEADQEKHEHRVPAGAGKRGIREHLGEAQLSGRGRQDQEARDQATGGHVRHREVEERGAPVLHALVLKKHQKIG